MPDTKDFRRIDEQIEGLEKRGLQFKNKKKAVDILKKYNYFDVINGFESILLKKWLFRGSLVLPQLSVNRIETKVLK